MIAPPKDIDELLSRADGLAGRALSEIATALGLSVPAVSRNAKGWAGIVVEAALGASAGSAPEPDFPHLGIELKTIPVRPTGAPHESTHVCVAPMMIEPGLRWSESLVRKKLTCVLWVPIIWERGDLPGDRFVGSAMLWRPNAEEEELLRQDWEEHIERIALGQLHEITARDGRVLQIRPKAATSRATAWTTDPSGARVEANPRGFYLRTSFTKSVLDRHFG